jgi:predicted nucleic acid-binding protein
MGRVGALLRRNPRQTLDAVHLAVASRLPGNPRLLTFDERQREAAKSLGIALAVD